MLKKGLRAAGEDEIEMRLEEIVTIFRLITDKDVFEEFYKIHLASRLLTRTQASDDVEKSMIAKLKAECGHQFTSKLEGMFKNIDLSTEINRGFQLWFQVSVCRFAARPRSQFSFRVRLPAKVHKFMSTC